MNNEVSINQSKSIDIELETLEIDDPNKEK